MDRNNILIYECNSCLCVVRDGLYLRSLEDRLSIWPSNAMMNRKLSSSRAIPSYFKPGTL